MRFLNCDCVVASLLAATVILSLSQFVIGGCDDIGTRTSTHLDSTIITKANKARVPSTDLHDTESQFKTNVHQICSGSSALPRAIKKTNAVENKVLTVSTVNPGIKKMKYILEGPLYQRCEELEKEIKMGVKKPFSEVTMLTVGDVQAHGQAPITFIRQVLALVSLPSYINQTNFPEDVKARAKEIITGFPGQSLGSYGSFFGNALIREHVAEFITQRDEGVPARAEDIILTNGATAGILALLELFSQQAVGRTIGVMASSPGFIAYPSFLTEFGMHKIEYFLNRTNNWVIDVPELERALNVSRTKCHPRAIFVTNPGNPSGRIVTRQEIENIIKFSYRHNLFILADEVYQEAVYDSKSEFHSIKKVMMQMGAPYNTVELASFFSVSKGYAGESGLRGGYVEVVNMDEAAKELLMKTFKGKSPPNSYGQVALDCIVNPPKPGMASYPLFNKEKTTIMDTLTIKANLMTKALNSIPGISTFPMQASFFIFPQITLPPAAIEAANAKGISPDSFYSYELLENTGMCVVAGEEFGQYPGTYYFRTSILPEPHKLAQILDKLRIFNSQFLEKYNQPGTSEEWTKYHNIQDKNNFEIDEAQLIDLDTQDNSIRIDDFCNLSNS